MTGSPLPGKVRAESGSLSDYVRATLLFPAGYRRFNVRLRPLVRTSLLILLLTSLVQPSLAQTTSTSHPPQRKLEVPASGPASPNDEEQTEVVYLRNGSTLQGKVSTTFDKLVIQLKTGIEVRLGFDQIRFRARDFDEAYLILASELNQGDPTAHLGLADWCLEHSMEAQFEYQLELAKRFKANPELIQSRLRALSLRRQQALQQREAPFQVQPVSATEPIQPAGRGSMVGIDEAFVNGLQTNQISNLDPAQLAEMTWLSQQLEIHFQQQIQLRLVHGCSAAGCHGPADDSSFRLTRTARGMRISRAQTRANLAQTLPLIEWQNAQESKLLQYSRSAHGDMKVPVYNENSKHYQEIEAWVEAIVQARGLRVGPQSGGSGSGQIQQIRRDEIIGGDDASRNDWERGSAKQDGSENGEFQTANQQNQARGIEGMPSNEGGIAMDDLSGFGGLGIRSPLDPELFNRLMHPERYASSVPSENETVDGPSEQGSLLEPQTNGGEMKSIDAPSRSLRMPSSPRDAPLIQSSADPTGKLRVPKSR